MGAHWNVARLIAHLRQTLRKVFLLGCSSAGYPDGLMEQKPPGAPGGGVLGCEAKETKDQSPTWWTQPYQIWDQDGARETQRLKVHGFPEGNLQHTFSAMSVFLFRKPFPSSQTEPQLTTPPPPKPKQLGPRSCLASWDLNPGSTLS